MSAAILNKCTHTGMCAIVCLKGKNTCMSIMSLKSGIPGDTVKPVANRHLGLLVRDLSSYFIQHHSKLLKADLDQMDNAALSYCIMKK